MRFFCSLFLPCFVLACADNVDNTPSDAGSAAPDAHVAADAAPADAAEMNDAGTSDAGTSDAMVVDGGFSPPAYGEWVKFEPEGATCSNGSPYKFFVNFSRTSSNAVVYFEGGGACWDYASCSGGARSAANRDGLPDNHAAVYAMFGTIEVPVDVIFPLLSSREDTSPMHDWNKIFIPYCTGDVFSGDAAATYTDPTGANPPLEFQHRGHANVMKTIASLSHMFENIPRMMVSGCSAGGTGALINYYFLRTGLNVEKGYLLDDSGPVFPDTATTSRSRPLHDRIRASWAIDSVLDSVPQSAEVKADLGNLAGVLADQFPNDRLAHTHFRLDYNYSLYSYERFYEVDANGEINTFGDGMGLGGVGLHEERASDRAAVYRMWWDDTVLLTRQFDARDNLAYFIPFYRETNDSHCLTIPGFGEFPPEAIPDLYFNDFPTLAWAGSDLMTPAGSLNVRGFLDQLLDDRTPLASYFETEGEGRFLACSPDPRYFDEAACAAVH